VRRRRKNANGSNGVSKSSPKQRRSTPQVSSTTESTESSELLLIVNAANLILSKAAALRAKQSMSQPETTVSEDDSFPKYVDEARVSRITGISQAWLQRSRSEGIGPPHKKIARRIVYRLDKVLDWVESGAAALEHVSPPRKKKRNADDGSDDDDQRAPM
jgi:hypothetical protein